MEDVYMDQGAVFSTGKSGPIFRSPEIDFPMSAG